MISGSNWRQSAVALVDRNSRVRAACCVYGCSIALRACRMRCQELNAYRNEVRLVNLY
jgi:hypothetical protein